MHWSWLQLCVLVILLLAFVLFYHGTSPYEQGAFRHSLRKYHQTRHRSHGDVASNSTRTKKEQGEAYSFTSFNATTQQEEAFDWKSHVRFFVLGAQKAGTTSLYKYMGQHPQIERSIKKETRCFQAEYKPTDPFCERYFANPRFRRRTNDYITGDFSPGYLWKGETAIPRIQKAYPKARFIVTLRHPIERAVSQFRMHQRNNKLSGGNSVNKTFDSLCMEELEILRHVGLLLHWKFPNESVATSLHNLQEIYLEATVNQNEFASFFGTTAMIQAWKQLLQIKTTSRGMIQKGLYALQLQRWLQGFVREQFLVISLEGTARDTQAVMQRIHAHLGIHHVPIQDTSPSNVGGNATTVGISEPMHKILTKLYLPFDEMLSTVLGNHQQEDWKTPWIL